ALVGLAAPVAAFGLGAAAGARRARAVLAAVHGAEVARLAYFEDAVAAHRLHPGAARRRRHHRDGPRLARARGPDHGLLLDAARLAEHRDRITACLDASDAEQRHETKFLERVHIYLSRTSAGTLRVAGARLGLRITAKDRAQAIATAAGKAAATTAATERSAP